MSTVLEALDALGAKASPQPWQHHMEGSVRVCDGKHASTDGCETLVEAEILRRPHAEAEANAALTALAVNHLRPLVAALEAMRGQGPNLGHDHANVKFGHDPTECRLCLANADAEHALAALQRDIEEA